MAQAEQHRSGCPINLSLEVLGDSWSLVVIRDIMFGNRRYYRQLLGNLRKVLPQTFSALASSSSLIKGS